LEFHSLLVLANTTAHDQFILADFDDLNEFDELNDFPAVMVGMLPPTEN
jgi:hypothetical protein